MVRGPFVRPQVLVSDIDAHPTSGLQHAKTFAPNTVQLLDIGSKGISVADLTGVSVVLDVPVGRRRNYKMHASIRNLLHGPGIVSQKEIVG